MTTDRDVPAMRRHPEARSESHANGLHVVLPRPAAALTSPAREDRRPRRLSAQACAADNLLSHSIEYLTDARKLPSGRVGRLSPQEPDVQAVILLMEARHAVYMACPIIERRSKSGLLGMFKGPDRRDR